MKKPLIVLTNDDGFGAPGLEALARALARVGRVVVVAPAGEQSAISRALSLHRIIRAGRRGPDRVALADTPINTVYLRGE